MASFGSNPRSLTGRTPAYGFRFFVYAVVCVVLMFYDQRGGWLESVRGGLSAIAYPLQLAVNSPSAALRWTRSNFAERAQLDAENAALAAELRELKLKSLRFAALERENAQLRGLQATIPPILEKTLVGEVVSVELSMLRQRLLINRGSTNGVRKAQPVMTADGVLGQVLRVGPWSAEIILITDAEHALPVEVLRSGLRTIAVGVGESDRLSLPYVPLNSDIRVDDLLVTSGLGGVFPQGLPVATITTAKRDPAQPLAQIVATPVSHIDRDRHVLFAWFSPTHPAAAGPATVDAEQTVGTAAFQPQPAAGPTATAPPVSTSPVSPPPSPAETEPQQ